jgi:hypothetical protein
MPTSFTEHLHEGGWIVAEDECSYYCRQEITIIDTAALISGTVVAKRAVPAGMTAAVTADAGNAGNGVFTIHAVTPLDSKAINGRYQVIFRGTGATAPFDVMDPNGVMVDAGAVGTEFNDQIRFTIADGGTDFAVGDRFFVDVVRESDTDEIWGALDFAATDGLQSAAGILFTEIDVGTGSRRAVVFVRGPAVARSADLTWPAGATATQKASAVQQLLALGIVLR